uniref:Head protein n=1 Tax=Dulem virus 36 TaxID=3145754 RepID=A0AAU8B080_9CAUD
MFNDTGIKREVYGNTNQILFAIQHQVSMGVVVSAAAGTVDASTGKKIVKAGTPLTGNLDKRETAFTKASAGSSTAASDAVGILLHDVDVTIDDNNGTLLLFGFVNTNRIDSTTKAGITDGVKAALPMIKFVAC